MKNAGKSINMVHYGPMSGGGGPGVGLVSGMPQNMTFEGLHQEPLNYMRANGAALLVAAVDVVDQQHQQQQSLLESSSGKGRSQFYCDQCNMVFGSKSAHTSHMKSHMKYAAVTTTTPPSPSSMEAAGNGTEVQGNFSGAVMPNLTGGGTGGDPYQCDKCNKTFAVPARLVSRKIEWKRIFYYFNGGEKEVSRKVNLSARGVQWGWCLYVIRRGSVFTFGCWGKPRFSQGEKKEKLIGRISLLLLLTELCARLNDMA